MPASTEKKPLTQVDCARQGDVATLQFTTEGGLNVLSSAVLGQLGERLEQLREDARLRFVLLRGSGKAFFAGADIAEMQHFDETRGEALSRHGHHVFDALEQLRPITIALLNGHTLGGGCELALACDFRIAARGIRIGLPEARLGLLPGWGGTLRLPRLVGPARARRLMFSGEQISAEEALQIGLVDDLADSPEQLDAAAQRWMELLRPAAPAAIARIKRALGQKDETKQFGLCFACADAREGMTAFLEKRPANWAAAK